MKFYFPENVFDFNFYSLRCLPFNCIVDTRTSPKMPPSMTQMFEDEFPLIRCCPSLNEIRIADGINDLTIELKGGSVIRAHRLILAARIPFLRPSLSETSGKESTILRWPSVPLDVADSFLTYLYTGQIEISAANVMDLILLARMMSLSQLETWGASFMASRVNVQNLSASLYLAEYLNIPPLLEVCIKVIRTGFQNVLYAGLFPHMSADTLLTLLRDDELSVDSEEQAFEALACWVSPQGEMDQQRLKYHVPEMLKQIRWQQTDIRFRERLLAYHPIFQGSTECLKLFAQIEQWIGNAAALQHRHCPFNRNSRVHRQPQSFFVFGKEQNKSACAVLRFDSKLEAAEPVACVEAYYGASFVALGERIFAVGGQTDELIGSSRVAEFMVKELRWQRRAPLGVRRQTHAATAVTLDFDGSQQGLMLVCGGSFKEDQKWHRLRSCEAYDPTQDRWYRLPDMRETRDGPAAVALPDDNRVFVFGGQTASVVHASVEYCHLREDWQVTAHTARTEDFWLLAAPMPTARSFLAAAPFRGRILVAGGWDFRRSMNVVEVFSPPDANSPHGEWTKVASMEQPRNSFTLLTSASGVFALGNDEEPKNTFEQFFAPENAVASSTTFVSWVWSPNDQIGNLEAIFGAVDVRI